MASSVRVARAASTAGGGGEGGFKREGREGGFNREGREGGFNRGGRDSENRGGGKGFGRDGGRDGGKGFGRDRGDRPERSDRGDRAERGEREERKSFGRNGFGDDRRESGDRPEGKDFEGSQQPEDSRGDRDRSERSEERGERSERFAGDRERSDRSERGPRSFDGDRRRGGEGARAGGGRPGERRTGRPDEPTLPDDVQASDLEPAVRRDLLSLDKSNAESVARHLVMVAQLLDEDPELALAHARAARQRAGRIAVVRETAGVAAYHAGEWAEALSELRTARRMSGGSGLLAVMADCERGLGRPERAIELGRSDEARALQGDEATELRIVVAGARMDLGQYDQAVVTLQTAELDPARTGSAAARLFYAYAEALLAADRAEEALTWFMNAASADLDGETDAEDRAADLAEGGSGDRAAWDVDDSDEEAYDSDDADDYDGDLNDEDAEPTADEDEAAAANRRDARAAEISDAADIEDAEDIDDAADVIDDDDDAADSPAAEATPAPAESSEERPEKSAEN